MGKGDPQSLEGRAFLKGVIYGPVQISTAQVKSAGKAGDHTVQVLLESREGKAEATLRGSYAKAVWKGTLETLRGSDTLGSWGLQQPASLNLSAEKVSLSPALITGTRGEMLELSMDMSLDPVRGALLSRWQRVNLARFAFLTPEWQVRGQTDGHIRADFRDKNKTTVSSDGGAYGKPCPRIACHRREGGFGETRMERERPHGTGPGGPRPCRPPERAVDVAGSRPARPP